MKVVIVGDGKVGGTIARQLSGEGHDIIVIDNNTSVLNNASNTMDIMSVEGNGASMLVQKRAGKYACLPAGEKAGRAAYDCPCA